MKRSNILNKILSLSLIALLLFLSCDERTPVASPPPELAYRLSLYVDNTSKECEEGFTDAECSTYESTAYAANNALDQLKITAVLEIDNESDGEYDGGHAGQNITFSWTKTNADENDINMGQFQVDENYIINSDETNVGETDINGTVEGLWLDDLALGNFELKATYSDQYGASIEQTVDITLISPESLISSVTGYTSATNNILEVPDNNIQTTYINASVSDQFGITLPNIEVTFSKISGSGSLTSSSAITGSDGVASVLYQTAPGTSDDIVTFEVTVDGPDDCENCSDQCQLIITSEIFPQEYYVRSFLLESDLYQNYNNDDTFDLVLEDESPDSTYVIAFEATALDATGAGVQNVPVYYRNLSSFGTITSGSGAIYTNEYGVASANLNIDRNDIPTGSGRVQIEASVNNPDDFSETLQMGENNQYDEGDIFTDCNDDQSICQGDEDWDENTMGNGEYDEGESFVDTNYGEALKTVSVDVFTEQALLASTVQNIQVSTSQQETIEDNNNISYETVITARTIDSYGGLVTEPVMINFQRTTFGYCDDHYNNEYYTCTEVGDPCTGDQVDDDGNPIDPDISTCIGVGGFLTQTAVMTDSTGVAESIFMANSADFVRSGATDIDFNIFVQENQEIEQNLNLSYFINGSQNPENDVAEFEYYPDSDSISHALYETTNISVMAKNSAGVGVSNVLVRFELDEATRSSFGELSSGYEYTCCGEDSSTGGGEETFSCNDGSGCDPDGEPCVDGSECTGSSSGAGGAGQNGVATVSYTNISEGIDQLRAYILDPNDASNELYSDIIYINSIPNCPDCSEELTLIAEDYTLPTETDVPSTNIYAFYTDSLGNQPAAQLDFMSFEAIQFDDELNEWVDVGSIEEVVYFQEGDVEDLEEFLPPSFELEGSSVVYAETNFNMENSSGFTRIVGTYGGLTDTLGLQINSTQASFVEILPPFPSEIIVQGGGGAESTLLTTEIRDGNGNLVTDPYYVTFELTPPILDGLHINGVSGLTSDVEISSNGVASITLNSGTKPGSVHVKVTVTDQPLGGFIEPEIELVAEATPVTITTGPPTSAVIGYDFADAVNIGAGLTEMNISIMLWDAWANPVSDSTAVYFSLDPPTAAAIVAEAKTGNFQPGTDQAWPGVAWTTTQYNSAQLFEFPEITATTTGNICINEFLNTEEACIAVDGRWLENAGENGLCGVSEDPDTGEPRTDPQTCDDDDYRCEELGLVCDTPATSGFGTNPDGDQWYWGIALPITFSSQSNLVQYENVCVDCTLTLQPLSDTQTDFGQCAPQLNSLDTFEVELRTRLLDSYGVPVEGAVVEVGIFDSQGNPAREGGGCMDEEGNEIIDPLTALPYINQQECLGSQDDATWGYGNWIDELDTYGNIQIQTDGDGYKFFRVVFTGDECVQTSEDPEQWSCSSPIVVANLLNANGAQSEQLQITINNTCLGN